MSLIANSIDECEFFGGPLDGLKIDDINLNIIVECCGNVGKRYFAYEKSGRRLLYTTAMDVNVIVEVEAKPRPFDSPEDGSRYWKLNGF
jgi:hypothetical protein